MIQLYNVLFVIRKEKYMIKSLMSILILTLFLSHCTTTDFINIGAGLYTGMEKKPNPIGAIKMIKKKNNDTNN